MAEEGRFYNADWMGSLPASLTKMPLSFLAVPGSHDSFSYWIDVNAPVGPDQPQAVKQFTGVFRSLGRKMMKKWSATQSLTFNEQLEAGIRYFDLRVSSMEGDPGNDIYFLHGLYGMKVQEGMAAINSFLNEHTREVVFLDFNHHYAMADECHIRLIKMLQEIFGPKLCSTMPVESITLQYLWSSKYQVLIFYHHPLAHSYSFLWPGATIPAPWANTADVTKLVQFLEATRGERPRNGTFHVTQAILTPRFKNVVRGLVGGLKGSLVERSLPVIMEWVKSQKPGASGVNIITSDFIELDDFATSVINLNNLLLEENSIT
ncbi:PI-PLC X domain-containing protein 2-like [Protopterus annectens]|uniref:PI-PLC X domain-containing protein 2-like n=1 Tax=Protopterus annectens TaxID=7888 RepID=UPI001CF936BE|nr:PI-PLC X domain-containing protein 2-like [Protopterus annectens]